jgi:hypothetical protein
VLARRLAQHAHRAAGRQEAARRVLRVDPCLDGVPADLRDSPARQWFSRRYPDLPFDQVKAGHEFGHRVLDLQPGVHLHEEELDGILAGGSGERSPRAGRAVDDELDRARAHVADAPGDIHRGLAHLGPQGRVEERRRGLLDDLLVAALEAALPLAQVHHGPVGVREDLDLDVPGTVHVPFD